MPLELTTVSGASASPGSVGGALPSRRAFLGRTALAAAGGLLLPGCRGTPGSKGNPGGWYALMSDIHLAADPTTLLRDECMAANLRAVMADIQSADDAPRGVLINGDLALKNGQIADYETLLQIAEPIVRARVPLHLTLGNHDDREHARTAFAPFLSPPPGEVDRCVTEIEGTGVRFLMLDSMISPNKTPGRLGPEQIAWVAKTLDRDRETPVIVMVHHNLNATWESALLDTDGLLAELLPRRQVKMVVFGHTHVWNVQRIEDLHAVNLPAVGYRFQPRQPLGWCQLRPLSDGCQLELRTVGGNQRKDAWHTTLAWRST